MIYLTVYLLYRKHVCQSNFALFLAFLVFIKTCYFRWASTWRQVESNHTITTLHSTRRTKLLDSPAQGIRRFTGRRTVITVSSIIRLDSIYKSEAARNEKGSLCRNASKTAQELIYTLRG